MRQSIYKKSGGRVWMSHVTLLFVSHIQFSSSTQFVTHVTDRTWVMNESRDACIQIKGAMSAPEQPCERFRRTWVLTLDTHITHHTHTWHHNYTITHDTTITQSHMTPQVDLCVVYTCIMHLFAAAQTLSLASVCLRQLKHSHLPQGPYLYACESRVLLIDNH